MDLKTIAENCQESIWFSVKIVPFLVLYEQDSFYLHALSVVVDASFVNALKSNKCLD